jgi:hypothetical protein
MPNPRLDRIQAKQDQQVPLPCGCGCLSGCLFGVAIFTAIAFTSVALFYGLAGLGPILGAIVAIGVCIPAISASLPPRVFSLVLYIASAIGILGPLGQVAWLKGGIRNGEPCPPLQVVSFTADCVAESSSAFTYLNAIYLNAAIAIPLALVALVLGTRMLSANKVGVTHPGSSPTLMALWSLDYRLGGEDTHKVRDIELRTPERADDGSAPSSSPPRSTIERESQPKPPPARTDSSDLPPEAGSRTAAGRPSVDAAPQDPLPGWKKYDESQERFWDGEGWTSMYRPSE